ncbi:pectic acid lyase [Clostridium puniceum]|uniref:Pectic acid lyase n=1 Tax=Clostridium puniceum TaxID=29367 RepID=A0A1S8T009_9CLOT|nr:pectate lyase [Clostridium puniceum]OOM71117.1 pectic acid lyase [Clostridium puniceum]
MLKSKLRTLSLTLMLTVGLTAAPAVMFQPYVTAFAAESSVATATIAEILKNQNPDGGWKKNYTQTSGEWAASTIDNGATYTEIRKLAAEYKKTKNTAYSTAALKGINFLISMQYANGGWPQVYKSSGYHTHITYNDDAMINVMILLDEVANKKGDFSFVDNTLAANSKKAVNKGVDCLINTQYKNSNGKLTIWGQQHNENTLLPDSARAYELPSLCAKESANILKFLKTRPSTPKIAASIKAAQEWFNTYKIENTVVVKEGGDVIVKTQAGAPTLWARFYDLKTNKPIFVGRDGIPKAKLSEIEKERRTGYLWYGKWASSI